MCQHVKTTSTTNPAVQSSTQVVMADVSADSSVPNDAPIPAEESGIQPETKQEDEPASESKNEGEERKERSNSDVYRYIKEDLFTSEIFKVEIQNLPKYIGFNDLKKFLTKHGLNPHKIKLMGKQNCAFVTFKNQVPFDSRL